VIHELRLIDPYTFWTRRAQRGLSQITIHLARATKGVRFARIVARPFREFERTDFATEDQALSALRTQIYMALKDLAGSAPRLAFEPRRKTPERDFHDRYVLITYEKDGQHRQREYLFTRGLEAVAEKAWSCDIIVTADKAVSTV